MTGKPTDGSVYVDLERDPLARKVDQLCGQVIADALTPYCGGDHAAFAQAFSSIYAGAFCAPLRLLLTFRDPKTSLDDLIASTLKSMDEQIREIASQEQRPEGTSLQ